MLPALKHLLQVLHHLIVDFILLGHRIGLTFLVVLLKGHTLPVYLSVL